MNFFKRLLFSSGSGPQSKKEMSLGQIIGTIGGVLPLDGSGTSSLAASSKIFKSQIWVRSCIEQRAKAISSVPWKVQRKLADGNYEQLPDHPLQALLKKPNPQTDGAEFLQRWMVNLDLCGNAYWEKVFITDFNTGGRRQVPAQLWSVFPDHIKAAPDPKGELKNYVYDPKKAGIKPETLEPSQVIHFQYIDPENPLLGLSPLASAARTINSEEAALTWNKSLLDNYAVPGGIIHIPAQAMDADERARIEGEIASAFTGTERHKPLALFGGLKWEQMALSQQDIQFLEQRNLNKMEICATFSVPPALVGANVDPTYSNYSIARLSFWEDTIIPLLDWLKTKINQQLAVYWGKDIEVWYDISQVPAFRDAFEKRVNSAEKLAAMHFPINDINRVCSLGMQEVPWGNVAWGPVSLAPLGEIPEAGDAEEDGQQEEEEEEDSVEEDSVEEDDAVPTP